MAAKPLTWFGGYEGVVASRGHALDLHLLDDAANPPKPFCGTEVDLRPVTTRALFASPLVCCPKCLELAQAVSPDLTPRPDRTAPQMTKFERGYRAALDRRRAQLERRLAEWDEKRDADRTRGELAALEWALRLIDACEEGGVLSTLRETGSV